LAQRNETKSIKKIHKKEQAMQKMNLELTSEQVHYLLAVLSDRPYKESAPMINHIQAQWIAQNPVQVVAPQKEGKADE